MDRIILPYLSAAIASGPDAGAFLQAQLTADISHLEVGDAGFAAYCDPSGNVLALMWVKRLDDAYIMVAARSLMPLLISRLGKYILRARVTLQTQDGSVVGRGNEGLPTYELPAAGELQQPAKEAVENWRGRELSAGIAWLDPETSGEYLPQMLGLERLNAVSFRKGCFPGQEVIARVRYLGKLKRKPAIVTLEGELDAGPGSEVRLLDQDAEVGNAVLVDRAASKGNTVALLVARAQEGADVNGIECAGVRLGLAQAWATM